MMMARRKRAPVVRTADALNRSIVRAATEYSTFHLVGTGGPALIWISAGGVNRADCVPAEAGSTRFR
jgi:hypothetical protein